MFNMGCIFLSCYGFTVSIAGSSTCWIGWIYLQDFVVSPRLWGWKWWFYGDFSWDFMARNGDLIVISWWFNGDFMVIQWWCYGDFSWDLMGSCMAIYPLVKVYRSLRKDPPWYSWENSQQKTYKPYGIYGVCIWCI